MVYDDSLDVAGVHGVGGLISALATGMFASKALNVHGANGLLYGAPQTMVTQILAIVAVILFSAVLTAAILKGIDLTIGLRVSPEDEVQGLDLTQHQEAGYSIG